MTAIWLCERTKMVLVSSIYCAVALGEIPKSQQVLWKIGSFFVFCDGFSFLGINEGKTVYVCLHGLCHNDKC